MHVFIPNSCVLNSAILLCPTLTLVSLPEHMARDGKFIRHPIPLLLES